MERGDFAQSLRRLAPRFFNATALCYHYHHMARSNARGYLFTEEVRLKKYFYVLRSLLAIRHIEHGLGIPPVRFDPLVNAVAPSSIRPSIAELVERKRNASELGMGKPIPEIDRFVRPELERHGDVFSGRERPDRLDKEESRHRLNEIFRSVVAPPPP